MVFSSFQESDRRDKRRFVQMQPSPAWQMENGKWKMAGKGSIRFFPFTIYHLPLSMRNRF
jgi:hypothetical protein